MIGICNRCNRETYIYNPKQEIKLCTACYGYLHRNKEKETIRHKKWQKENTEWYRNYYAKNKERIKINREKRNEKKKMIGKNENEKNTPKTNNIMS
jgi:transposase